MDAYELKVVLFQISDSVVRRLKGELQQGREEVKAARQPVRNSIAIFFILYQVNNNTSKFLFSDDSNDIVKSPSEPTISTPPVEYRPSIEQTKESSGYGHIMEEAHLTALKIRQEKEAELRRVEEHWRNQLLNLTNHVRQKSQ